MGKLFYYKEVHLCKHGKKTQIWRVSVHYSLLVLSVLRSSSQVTTLYRIGQSLQVNIYGQTTRLASVCVDNLATDCDIRPLSIECPVAYLL